MAFDETEFHRLADETIETVSDRLDDLLGDTLDVDLQSGILSLELDSGEQFVINKHSPNRQIWMSSPVSGASHYDYDEDTESWRSTRGATTLHEQLSADLSVKTGQKIVLD
ncbi:iron donor protein CyaY [Thalassospira sp.]|uniref:iron donor protein CyaY n=1 Tax=Thalassospira sp. TaxID=1912094 RepID=UPI002736F206|nr:iron donor protein CyaY [Thalassospira sp.]MDP2699884.1 iron donor protein CyaY [Thalassospira sp.]